MLNAMWRCKDCLETSSWICENCNISIDRVHSHGLEITSPDSDKVHIEIYAP